MNIKRSKNLLKYKEFMDDEFTVLDIYEGKAKKMVLLNMLGLL